MKNAKSWRALVRAFRGDLFRRPRATRVAAERAALRETPREDLDGVELLRCHVPAGRTLQPLEDAPPIPGPLEWWDYGDPREAAEEYGCRRGDVHVIAVYRDGQWRRP